MALRRIHRTRDVGRFDDNGYLYLVDRTSDMIVTGRLQRLSARGRGCAGRASGGARGGGGRHSDDKWGEAVAAFVALRPGESADDAALMAFARGRLAGYKVPKSVHFIDEVPKSPVGKLLRRAVRDPFWKGRERRVG